MILPLKASETTENGEPTLYRIREDEPPKKTGIGYKVFVVKDGKEYYVRFTVQRKKSESGLHSTFVTNVDVYNNPAAVAYGPSHGRGRLDYDRITDAKLRKYFELANKNGENNAQEPTRYRIREEESPKKTGIGYKVFVVKDGKLYPPMVANPGGEATPVGVWLVIDEIQSNRHQDAREKGYYYPEARKAYTKWVIERAKELGVGLRKYIESDEYNEERENKKAELGNIPGLVPATPFEKNWHEVAMKRMLRLAADEGFDKVAWTTGEQQSARYDLRKVIGSVSYKKNQDGTYDITCYKGTPEAGEYAYAGNGLSEDKLRDTIGAGLTAKIVAGEGEQFGDSRKTIRLDENTSVGGEGMKGFYDDILPHFMDKYGKKWGVKTGEVVLSTPGGEVMHSVDVTDAMRAGVRRGQPLFQREELPVVWIDDKQEYAKVAHAINTFGTTIPKKGEIYSAFTDNNYYLYTSNEYGTFKIHAQIPIVGNEEYIEEIRRNQQNGSYETPAGLIELARELWDGQNFTDSRYASNQGRRGGAERPVSVDVPQQADGAGGNGQLGRGVSAGSEEDIASPDAKRRVVKQLGERYHVSSSNEGGVWNNSGRVS